MSPEKLRRVLHIALTVIGTAVCALFSIPAAIVLAVTSAAVFAVDEVLQHKRKKVIFRLCDDIDRILKGCDSVTFADYKEGSLSILTAEIHKMTIMLREQNSALSADKQFMKESMEDIAHQLRTPLTSMILLVELLRAPKLAPQQRAEYVQELYSLLSLEAIIPLDELIAGERRLRACRLLGMKEIPCIVQQTPQEMSAMMALIENIQRRDLHYIEEAECYRALLMRYGMTQEQLAARLGKSQSFIANKVRLLTLSPAVRQAALSGALSERRSTASIRASTSFISKGLEI